MKSADMDVPLIMQSSRFKAYQPETAYPTAVRRSHHSGREKYYQEGGQYSDR